MPFLRDTRLMMREQRPGPAWPNLVAYGGAGAVAVVWLAALLGAVAQESRLAGEAERLQGARRRSRLAV